MERKPAVCGAKSKRAQGDGHVAKYVLGERKHGKVCA